MKLHPLVLAIGLTPLVGCGSNSSEPIPVEPTTYSVRAVDGYLRNALVWLDTNGNFQLDEGEPQAKSEEGGIAILDVSNIQNPENYSVVVKAIVGETVDEDSITESNPDGIATTTPFLLSAPAGQTVVTPLSTLVNIKMDNGLTQQQATAEVATDLGIAEDALLGDYIAGEQGSIAAKANALVELAVLPESEQQMQEMSQDDSGLAQELASNLTIVQALTAEQRLVKEEDGTVTVATNVDSDDDGVIDGKDAFPDDPTETLDSDKDGKGNNSDAFPDDPTETLDSDKDGKGDNSDAFPDDPTETLDSDKDGKGDNSDAFPDDPTEILDSDKDGKGDNSDAFPDDPTETLDSDKDGKGDNSDAYINDPEKSVLDSTSNKTYTTPFIHPVFRNVTTVEVKEDTNIETFNNGDIKTTTWTTYTALNGIEYGEEGVTDLLKTDGSFSRYNEWRYDFNLDGDSQFVGAAIHIGNRTTSGESFVMYVDESDAALEGGNNGGGRNFDDIIDFNTISRPSDLSLIDFVASVTVTWQENATSKTTTTDLIQYPASGFDYTNLAASQAEYAEHKIVVVDENGVLSSIEKYDDWQADESINESIELTITAENEYHFNHKRPVWADPTDAVDEEYADFNFGQGKWDSLTPYWYETNDTVDAQGIRTYAGHRYVLDRVNEANVKLVDADNPDGLLFQEYVSTQKSISDTEKSELVNWTHYPLADYHFTVDSQDTGQAYKVFQKQSNGIWVGYSFPEWGSQSIVDLDDKIEAARAGGTMLSEIDETVVAGLSAYNLPISTPSFAYEASGKARLWYFVSNNAIFDNDGYTLTEVRLIDDGIKDGWKVVTGPDQFIFLQPKNDEPWNWFDAYNRIWSGIETINTGADSFMWGNWLGEFYLNESQAQARLTELQAAHLFGSWANEYVSFQFNNDMTYLMEQKIDDGSGTGSESGTFSYDSDTGKITVTSIIDDQNGSSGLSDYLNDPEHIFQVTSYVTGNSVSFFYVDEDESDEFTLTATTEAPFAFTTDWLVLQRTLYNVFTNDAGSAWETVAFTFADSTTFTATESDGTVYQGSYRITEDGYIELRDSDETEPLEYIRALSSTDGYLTLAWSNSLSNVASASSGSEYFFYDSATAAEFIDNYPTSFTAEWLSGRTLYEVWFGDGDLVDEYGNAVDYEGNLISNPDNEISLTDVAVVQEVTYNSDGTLTVRGLKNSTNAPGDVHYHYQVDAEAILRIVEEQDEATEGSYICDNSTPDYLKTHFIVNGVFDNVDLLFFDKQKALDYAQNLNTAIPPCTP